jgi:hypothetical protein
MPKEVDNQVKASIQSAVESLAREFSHTAKPQSQKARYIASEKTGRHTIVFVGVLAFTLLIGAMWIINLRQSYILMDFTKAAENDILSTSRDDFNTLLKAFEDNETNAALREHATISAELGTALEKKSAKAAFGSAIQSAISSSTISTTTIE